MSPRDPPTNDSTSLALTAPSTGTTTISSDDGANSLSAETSTTTSPVLQATASMCHHCFDVLLHHLKRDHHHQHHQQQPSKKGVGIGVWRLGGATTKPSASSDASATPPQPAATFVEGLPNENVECPLFVTWERKRPLSRFHIGSAAAAAASKSRGSSSGAGGSSNATNDDPHDVFELRGCIGTLSPRPLATSIGEYALISAFKDKRFDPVRLTEVPQLRVAVSLLVQYEECRDCHDWHVGVHGIVIRWREGGNDDDDDTGIDTIVDASTSNTGSSRLQRASTRDSTTGRDYSATYLPEVAADQGWDQQTAVSSLIRKAGFYGSISPGLLARVKCTRYQSSKHRLTFEEYIQQQQSASSQSSSQAAAQHQQHGQEQLSSSSPTTPLSNDELVAEAIRELGHLPKLQGGVMTTTGGGRDASPPTCRVL